MSPSLPSSTIPSAAPAAETVEAAKHRFNGQGGYVGISFSDQDTDTAVEYPPSYLLTQGIHFHAQRTPDALCFRYAVDITPGSSRSVDVSYARAATLVEEVADRLRTTFSAIGVKLEAGTTVSLLTLPYCQSFLQMCALWHLGCAVQWFNHELGRTAVDQLLQQASSQALLFSGLTAEEEEELGVGTTAKRINVPAICLSDDELLLSVITNTPHRKPSPPMPFATFTSLNLEQAVCAVMHTSGSTGVPKIVRWDRFSLATQSRPQYLGGVDEPYMVVTRPYWGTSLMMTATSLIVGSPLMLMSAADRIYPSTREMLNGVAATKAGRVVLFAGQTRELLRLIQDDERYLQAASLLRAVVFVGTAIDAAMSVMLESIRSLTGITFVNGHGLSEIMSTTFNTFSAPYNGLQIMSDSLLMQPLPDDDDGGDSTECIVKLWISMDRNPILWYQYARGYALSLQPERYPGPGPMTDRPAIDTGDIFVKRTVPDGRTLYFHRGRTDDVIRLSNLYRPNVQELEGSLNASLVRPDAHRLPAEALKAVQLFGDGRPKLAVVVHLRDMNDDKLTQEHVCDSVRGAIEELDQQLPPSVRFNGDLRRVRILYALASASTTANGHQSPPSALLVTHKGNLRRTVNTAAFAPWLDTLPWDSD